MMPDALTDRDEHLTMKLSIWPKLYPPLSYVKKTMDVYLACWRTGLLSRLRFSFGIGSSQRVLLLSMRSQKSLVLTRETKSSSSARIWTPGTVQRAQRTTLLVAL